MSSPPAQTSSKSMDVDPQMPFEQVLERAKQQSLPHLRQLIPRVAQQYRDHPQSILNAIVANLSIPTYVEGFEPSEIQLTAAFNAILCLKEIVRVYNSGRKHLIDPGILVVGDVAERYPFWALRLLGVPASPTSPNPALQLVPPQLRLSFYDGTVTFLNTLFKIPAISYQMFPSHLKPAILDVAIALWISLPNGEPPIYPSGNRGQADPGIDSMDPSTELVCRFVEKEDQAMATAVMDGRVCSPEVFARRTIGRVQALGSLKGLQHLSHLPPTTSETRNIALTMVSTMALSRANPNLRRVFVEEGSTGAYFKVLSTLAERMEDISNGEIQPWSVPNNLPQWFFLVDWFIDRTYRVLHEATSSPVSILREVESVVSNGLIRILAVAKRHRPRERKAKWDEIWDELSMHAFYLEVLPGLYKDVMDHLEPTLPLMFAKRVNEPDPTTTSQRPGWDEPSNPRDIGLSVDMDCLEMMSHFVEKQHRVKLCDNLNHYARIGVYEESKTQEEQSCSRCRSVVYCSPQCQQEDWRAFHRKECVQMAKDHTSAKNADQVYSYDNRTFQTSVIRYAWESLIPNRDRRAGAIPYSEGRDGVVLPDLYRPMITHTIEPSDYLERVLQDVPARLRPRLSEYLKVFVDTNGSYAGSDPTQVKAQNRRLLAKSFCFGNKDVNLLVLLHRVSYVAFEGNDAEVFNKTTDYKYRGPEAKSDYLVQGVMSFMSPRGKWSRFKVNMDDVMPGLA